MQCAGILKLTQELVSLFILLREMGRDGIWGRGPTTTRQAEFWHEHLHISRVYVWDILQHPRTSKLHQLLVPFPGPCWTPSPRNWSPGLKFEGSQEPRSPACRGSLVHFGGVRVMQDIPDVYTTYIAIFKCGF